MMEAEKILQTFWGHRSFRPLQGEIIQKVMEGQDILALLPTGGGKSLCFQIPALLKPGICIVVSPLIALMQDQVTALKEKGIKAMAITGGIKHADLDIMLDNCIYGNYKFLYLSPERLQQELVKERIKQMDVNLIAVDEAHCISQWGHDFRPAYKEIKVLKELHLGANFICLTATATKKVIQDILDQLEIPEALVMKKSFARENLAYVVKKVQDKNSNLKHLLNQHQEASIVYVRTRKATVETTGFLKEKNINVTSYHGGITNTEKYLRLQQWLTGEKRVMVATNAFGMGIDKPEVRSVIHISLPDSLESYFQEAGRAGRDGKSAKAILLTNDKDIPIVKEQFLSNLPSVAWVKLVYKKLMTYFRIAYGEGEGSVHDFNFLKFCHQYKLHTLKTFNTLQLLDRTSVLQLTDHFQKKTSIQFLTSSQQLTWFLEANPQFDAVTKAILRTYGGVFEHKVEINLKTICSKADTGAEDIIRLLKQLHKEEILDFEHDQHDARITFLVPREDDSTINPLAPYIRMQKETKTEKIRAVLQYVNNDETCKSEQLLRYFGETDTKPCGICSVCKPASEEFTGKMAMKIYEALTAELKRQPRSSWQLAEILSFKEAQIIQVLQMLEKKRMVTRTSTNLYKLNQK